MKHLGSLSIAARLRSIQMLLVISLTAVRIFAADQPVDTAFENANRLYAEGKFAEAAELYSRQIETGTVSPALYFNLGNALYKSGEIGKAVIAMRSAQRLAPRDPEIQANLQFIRNQIQGPTLKRSALQNWFGRLKINEWTLITCAFFWSVLLLVAAGQVRTSVWRAVRGATWVAVAGLLLFSTCLGVAVKAASIPTAVVTTGTATVRNGPLEAADAVFTAHGGAEFRVDDQKNGWILVEAIGQSGWINSNQVQILRSF